MSHIICDDRGYPLDDAVVGPVMGPVVALWRALELATTLGTTLYVYGPGDTAKTATRIQPDPAMALRLARGGQHG